jgi:DNA processing protein
MEATSIQAMLLLPRIGRKTVAKILSRVKAPPSNIQELFDVVTRHAGKRGEALDLEDVVTAIAQAQRISRQSEALGIQAVPLTHASYPDCLRETSDPPAILYIKGNTKCVGATNSIAIIGTREPTDFATNSAFSIARVFAEKDFVIVSGLALGCDTHAHEGCIAAEGQPVAVLAHGLDSVHPRSNSSLADHILTSGGALVSEYPVGKKPQPSFFIDRDRIQSGLSKAVVVVETTEAGGTMHTAAFAQEQGRKVAVVAHPKGKFTNSQISGNLKLLAEKTTFVISGLNDLHDLATQLTGKPNERPYTQNPQSGDAQTQIWDGF